MSDALLTEISKKLSDIHAALAGGTAPKADAKADAVKAAADKAAKAAAEKAAKAAADKAAADKAAAAPKTTTAKAGTAPVSGTKAPGGKHTIDEVRELLRQVATTPGLGKAAALAILDENGGVDHLSKLKPENFDAVYEAAQVELSGVEGGTAEEDDGLGL